MAGFLQSLLNADDQTKSRLLSGLGALTNVWVPLAIEFCGDAYRDTKNPLFLWFGYRLAREFGVSIPDEFQNYLDGVASRVFHSAEIDDDPLDIGAAQPGSRGRRTEFERLMRDYSMATEVWRLLKSGDNTEDACIDVAEEYGVSEDTVRRAYRNHKEQLP